MIDSRGDDRYGLLFELSDDAVAEVEMVDQVPIVCAVNPAFVDVFGYDREAIVGESLNEFIVPDNRHSESATLDRRTAEGEANWATVSRQTADGIREFLYRGVPFERDGTHHGLAIYTDVTAQRRRERHHQVLHRVLRHNLRNDLTQILSAVEALADSGDEGVHTRRIRAAVDDLEDLSRAAGKVEDLLGGDRIESRSVEVFGVIRSLVAQYQDDYPDLAVEADLTGPLRVTADYRLEVALDALIENAVKHGTAHSTERGADADSGSSRERTAGHDGAPIAETADPDRETLPDVEVSVTTDRSEAVVRITDDGPGIPEYERAAVFDDKPLSQLSHGSGLGLWLAKWIVESYGGRISYERRGGRTTVAARLPLATV